MNIVEPHRVISKEVNLKEDQSRVIDDSARMVFLITEELKRGEFNKIYALAHSQVTDKDPLRFFVISKFIDESIWHSKDSIIVNPVIKFHSKYTAIKQEGCVSFRDSGNALIERWPKCEVEYLNLDGKLIKLSLTGKASQMFQHEIDHMDAKYIFDMVKETKEYIK